MNILTYGTFDLFHIGHLNLLQRLKQLGSNLIVGISTDEFNKTKGKTTIIPYQERFEIIKSLRVVDLVISEYDWNQKHDDIIKYNIQLLGMGSDWEGEFDYLKEYCEVLYLPRTEGISSTILKNKLKPLDKNNLDDLIHAIEMVNSIVEKLR
jgi:glycerol-3-phosphate cytidylyltransferase